ncbi:MAG: glycosyltransferase family 1 protein [Elusimicrobiota bacterium]
MRIGIEISSALNEGSGLRRYIELLLDALARVDRENEYFLYAAFWTGCPDRIHQVRLPKERNFHLALRRFPQRILLPLERFLRLPIQESWLRPLHLDVFHGTGNVLPRLRSVPSVLTLHHVGGPWDTKTWWEPFYFKTQTAAFVRSADKIIAISDFTRGEVTREWGVPPERVARVYYGGPAPLFRVTERVEDLSVLGVRRPFLLFVSEIKRRKNLDTLVRAFSMFKRSDEGRGFQLVLVGRKSPYFEELRQTCRESGVDEDVIFRYPVTQEQLRSLYQSAEALVYPSKLEGFGLPPLEAMACGTPVVAARAASLPEVIGDAGILVDPDSPEGFHQAIRAVTTDRRLKESLVKKGFERIREFTWERAARETLEVYRSLAA